MQNQKVNEGSGKNKDDLSAHAMKSQVSKHSQDKHKQPTNKESQSVGGSGFRNFIALSNQVIEQIEVRQETKKQEEFMRQATMKAAGMFHHRGSIAKQSDLSRNPSMSRGGQSRQTPNQSRAITPPNLLDQGQTREQTPKQSNKVKKERTSALGVRESRESLNLTSLDSNTITNSMSSRDEISRKHTPKSTSQKSRPKKKDVQSASKPSAGPTLGNITIEKLQTTKFGAKNIFEAPPNINVTKLSLKNMQGVQQQFGLKNMIGRNQSSMKIKADLPRARAQSMTKITVKKLQILAPVLAEGNFMGIQQREPLHNLPPNNKAQRGKTQYISPMVLQRLQLDIQGFAQKTILPQKPFLGGPSHQLTSNDFHATSALQNVFVPRSMSQNLLPLRVSGSGPEQLQSLARSQTPKHNRLLSEAVSQALQQKIVGSKKHDQAGKDAKRQEVVDPDSFAGFIEKNDTLTQKKRKLISKIDSNKTDHLDEFLLDTQGDEMQLREKMDSNNNIFSELRQKIVAEVKKKVQETVIIQSAVPAVIQNSSSLQPIQEQVNGYDLASRVQVDIKEEVIEFYGDPNLEGLVRFNADMGHVSLNIFETFTVFDLIQKQNQCLFESIQLIESQNSIIEQRQDNIDNKLDDLEQQLLKIRELKSATKRSQRSNRGANNQ